MNLPQLPITLYPSRGKLIFWIITAIGIMIFGFWKLQQGRETETEKQILIGAGFIGLSVLAIPMFALRFHPKISFLRSHIQAPDSLSPFFPDFRTRPIL